MKISLLTESQRETMLGFIIQHNQDGEHHVGFFGLGENEIRETLAEFIPPLEESFLLAWEGEALVGLFGADYDLEIDRAWLYGPLVAGPNWHETADALYAALQDIIPSAIHEQELFFDIRNQRGQEFAARHAFPPRSDNAVLYLEREAARAPAASPQPVCDYETAFFEQFETLHNDLFPHTYFTARQIVEKLDETHRLLLAVENGQVLGYIFCKRDSVSAYIDFIGVAPAARGQGLGAALLERGIAWMFARPEIRVIDLTVNADNAAALRLYQTFGFVTKHILRGFRKSCA